MQQNEDNTYRIDADKAWNILYSRLEKDQLLTGETEQSHFRKRKLPLQWMAVAAAVCLGIIFSVFYFQQHKDNPLLVLKNKENSGALVATLEDGSIVYLAPNASISYPSAFTAKQRKVELDGNALFSVTKDKERPFVIETNKKVTIEVVGTIFAVRSSSGNPFELSVMRGKVNVCSNSDQTTVPVEAGEIVHQYTGGLSKSKITDYKIFSRFTDKMCFKDEKLNNIVHAINTTFGSPVLITEESLNDRTLTVTFENNSVETMTELICAGLNLKQVNKQDTIYIGK
jgi:ferric-dicitrate binding protein FerR (iron transport regulator)